MRSDKRRSKHAFFALPSLLKLKNRFIKEILLKIMFRINDGFYVLQENWRNLIILDDCRFDTFQKMLPKTNLSGKLDCRISRGTETVSFLRENFGNRGNLDDIVYITANPQVDKSLSGKFHAIIPVWKFNWDTHLKTVLPNSMYQYVKLAQEKYPDKRYIIHYLQPHRPFIGFQTNFIERFPAFSPYQLFTWGSMKENGRNLFLAMSRDSILKIYEWNLLLVLREVELLAGILRGKTIVTSDHGEAFGEFIHPFIPIRVFGHPARTRISALTLVPWFELQLNGGKELTANPQQIYDNKLSQLTDSEYEIITSRLRDLGYE